MKFQIFDVDYVIVNEKPVIRIFGKDEAGATVCGFYENFRPYFFVAPKSGNMNGLATELEKNASVKEVELVKKHLPVGYRAEPAAMLKVVANTPNNVAELRDRIKTMPNVENVYEADIQFRYRFLNDMGLRGMQWAEVRGEPVRTNSVRTKISMKISDIKPVDCDKNAEMKYLALDTEMVSAKGGIPDPKTDPIIMISVWFSPAYQQKQSLVLATKPVPSADTISFGSEKAMLEKLMDIINEYDPDVITGYNINNFDMPYIIGRLEANRLPKTMGRCSQKSARLSQSMKGANRYRVSIPGRFVVDSYQLVKKNFSLKRYGLGDVSKQLIGEDKKDVAHSEIGKLWNGPDRNGLKKLEEYARKDAELAMKLLISKNLMDKYVALSSISGALLQDVLDGGESVRVETLLLSVFSKNGFVLPCRPTSYELNVRDKQRMDSTLKGGFVLEPATGLHAGSCILVMDFKSMYPSIFRSYNICPTTLITDGSNIEGAIGTPSGHRYAPPALREGILPCILKGLMEERSKVRKFMKTETDPEKTRMLWAKQYGLKIMANAFYGYSGYMRAKTYVMDVANSVTSCGRFLVQNVRDIVEKDYGFKVIYGDSITADRFVTVMDRNGFVKIKNIEELFIENKNETEFVAEKEIINLKGYRALTTNPLTKKTEWMPIRQIIRHKTNKKIFRINQKYGETIATEDHSIITENGGRFEETKPQDMTKREMVRVRNVPKLKRVESIDLYDILSGYKTRYTYKGNEKTSSVREEGGWLVFGWMDRKNPVKVNRTVKVGSEEFESLCRLVGAYISEGSSSTTETTKSRYGASIASSDIKWLEQLREDYLKIFKNAKASIVKSTTKKRILNYESSSGKRAIEYEDGTHKLQMMNGLAAVFFKMLCGQKSRGKKIPDFVYHVPEKFQRIVLENMIKGDGSRVFMNMKLGYSEKYKQNNFRYESRSLHLTSGLSFLLSSLGQNYTIRFRPPKNTYILTTTTKNNSNTPTKIREESYEGYVYDLSVEGSHMFVDSCGQILLHNTDSIFVKTDIADMEKAWLVGADMSTNVTKRLSGVLELDFEKIFKSFLILTKKRYAAWKFEKTGEQWKDDIEMKGIETVRRDWCDLVSKTMKKTIETLLKKGDSKEALDYFKGVLNDLSNNRIPINELMVTKSITKGAEDYDGIQPHIELLKKMQRRNIADAPGIGDRIGYVIVKGQGLLSKRAEDPAYVVENGLEIDSQYYTENQLIPPIERIFTAIGITKSELLSRGKQTSIFDAIKRAQPSSAAPSATTVFDGFVCSKCDRYYPVTPLVGACACGGELMFSGPGGPVRTLVAR